MMKAIKLLFIAFAATAMLWSCSDSKTEQAEATGLPEINTDSLPTTLTPEVLWMMGRVNDVQVSPDGTKMIYGITYYDADKNSGENNIYIQDVEGGEPKLLIQKEGSEFGAVWRPDGERIGFLAANDSGIVQLYEVNAEGGDMKMLTDFSNSISGFKYAPDFSKILYTQDVKMDATVNEKHEDLPKAEARVIDDLMYRHWDNWHDYKYSHIFFTDYDEKSIAEGKDILEGEPFDSPMNPWGGLEQINWSPDAKQIAYVCKKLSGKEWAVSTNSEIYLYNIEEGTTTNLSEEGYDGYDHDPLFSPNGEYLVWKSMETPGFEADKERIILYTFADGTTKDISEGFDQSSNHFAWTDDSKEIFFMSGYHATTQIYKINIETADTTQITSGQHNITSFTIVDDKLIATKTTHHMPTEIFSYTMDGEETQLSFVNKKILDHITMATSEERWIETTDGKQMLTWVVYPPDFDSTKTYPTLLYCQGGPQSAVSQFFSYRWNFSIMAAQGYIVVAPNRRGLPSFGQEWNDQISGDYGGQNMKDYLAAIDEMAKESYVDENNLGAVGASYGGFSVYWLAGHHEKRFKAFISHCGMYNFESMYAATEEFFFVNHDMKGAPWDKPKAKAFSEFSPHLSVDKWDTPIMVITGARDFRIPYTESLQAFNAAQLRGVPSRLLYFPDETHFVLKPQNSILWQREFFGWLDQYLKESDN